MIKLLGAALILAVGGFSAFSSARYEKKRLSVLDGWIDLIVYIRSQIDCFLMPLDAILQNGDRTLLDACMSPDDAVDLGAILRASSLYLDGEVKRLLENFVRETGSTFREEQLKRCDYYVSALRTQRERLAAALPARRRLSTALCLCISIGTAILLW
ncbi:MAG: hypothetical protein IJW29_04450 [Clostridia bacterium]|nr:hypothetical protein [Clostridia bacterium]